MNRSLSPSAPKRRQWSGLWWHCPLCHQVMDMVVEDGQSVYECGRCVAAARPRQVEMFAAEVAA